MTVLHISGARSWGGNEQQLMYLMDELPKYGVIQKLFCFQDTPIFKEAEKRSVEILSTSYCKPHTSEYRKFLISIINQYKIDLIHLHTSDSVTGYVLTDLLHALKTPTLFARKGIRRKTGFLSKLKYNYHNIDTILCISKYVEKHFRKILTEKNRQKLVTVYNGVKVSEKPLHGDFDIREKFNIAENIFLIGNIANHTNAKDLPILIEVLNEMVNRHGIKTIKLFQIGEHSGLTPELKKKIKEYDLESYIILTGFLSKASAYLPQFDVFLMTSEREGGPSSVVEAFYNKTPVVSTRVGVVDEVIEDGVNGFSTEVKNPSALAGKLMILRENPDLRRQFAEKSYQMFLKKFTAENLGKSTFRVYENMLLKNKK
ncbi:glycosyltransferase family 4 protein [Christiangramia forsetii]|uniref:Glycosyl transferase, group 1 n=2 Tax=Christiangramia forsetii TaxID=411153 RepID=A0M3Q0_CHRFK|nr:glycosyltransferase family 4 protein [Christiangramia forsetii]GGG25272.1 glycosyl transferase [Christiangramia forsetii]CAL67245.1 glycosyl transferase, group 1 [Christiangramia forsetii KT0803]